MWQEDRLQRIKAMLATFDRVSTERVAEDLGVSRETVRRDLVTLEAEGVVKRVHGGAVAVQGDEEAPFAQRSAAQVKEKRAIARLACRLIAPGQSIFLDAGSTTSLVAEELASLSGLTVLTNSVDVASKMLSAPGAEVHRCILIGGQMAREPLATYGAATVAEIHRYRADWALLSPVGVDPRYGATSFQPEEAEVARAMAANAAQVCIMADHTKWGTVSRVSYCAVDKIDHLIGDPKVVQTAAYSALVEKVGVVICD
jgi:DeoR/GlpR family transcriptional regulator of sugar metabolism